MLQSKDIERMNELKKNKTHIYAAYSRLTSDWKTHTDWKWRDRKMYSMQMKWKES